MPHSLTPVGRPLLALAETVDVAFRLDHTVGPTMPLVSRLNHAAYMLAIDFHLNNCTDFSRNQGISLSEGSDAFAI